MSHALGCRGAAASTRRHHDGLGSGGRHFFQLGARVDFCASGGEANYDATLRLVMRTVIEKHDDGADGILGVVGRSLHAHSRTDPERLCCGVHASRLVAGAACGADVACHVVGGDDALRTVIGPAVGVIVVVEQNAHAAWQDPVK